MTEFKVGDRVRVREGSRYAGAHGVVTKVRGAGHPLPVTVGLPYRKAGINFGTHELEPAVKDDVVVDDDGPDAAPGLRAMVKEVRERHDVDHPAHYTWAPVEVIELTEWLNFNLGNVVKYVCRADHKGNPEKDLQKALWYLNREIERRQKHPDST